MQTLTIDIETYSDHNIRAGTHKYAEKSVLLLLSYSIDFSQPEIVDFPNGGKLPFAIFKALTDSSIIKWAHNAEFERVNLSKQLGIDLPHDQWRCSAALARSLSLPASLESLSEILGLPPDKVKMSEGKKLIKKFCTPEGKRPEGYSGEDWNKFKEYCKRDVTAAIECIRRMTRYMMPDEEWRLYALDQKINDNGLPIDMDFVRRIVKLADDHRVECIDKARVLSGLENPNSRNQMLAWLKDNGIELETLQAKDVTALQNMDLPEDVEEMVEYRAQLSKSSISKYTTLLSTACEDDRLRGAFLFYGAGTGRWSGSRFQPQNLIRPTLSTEEIEIARELVKSGADLDTLDMLYPDMAGMMSSLVRSSICAPPGKKLTVIDLSSIEPVMGGWYCESKYILDLFRNNLDIYKDFATHMYHIEYEVVTDEQRKRSKAPTLGACYGMGARALKAYALNYGVQLTEEEAKAQVDTFRRVYRNIPETWNMLIDAAVNAINHKSERFSARSAFFTFDGRFLILSLPSGRNLYYYQPRVEEGKFGGDVITYLSRGKIRIWSHGAKLYENVIQAISRDVLREGLFNVEKNDRLLIVGHVHDEIISESDIDYTDALPDMTAAMTKPPAWCSDAPINAKGYEAKYYRKD